MNDRTRVQQDDEAEFEDLSSSWDDRPVDLNRFNRDEEHVYESIEDEIGNLDEVVRDLSDFEFEELSDEDLGLLNDSAGG